MLGKCCDAFSGRRQIITLCKKPRIAVDRAAEHDAVATRFCRLHPCFSDITHVAVPNNKRIRIHFIANFYGTLDPFPLRRHCRHFFARPRMYRNCGRTLSEKLRKPRIQFILRVSSARLNGYRQTGLLRGTDEFARKHRVFYERRATLLTDDFIHRTTHIYIDAVETEICHDLRRFFHVFWYGTKKLRRDWPLRFTIDKFLPYPPLPFLVSQDKTVGRGKFGKHHVWLAVSCDEPPKCGVGHVFHRGKRPYRPRQSIPKARHGQKIAWN